MGAVYAIGKVARSIGDRYGGLPHKIILSDFTGSRTRKPQVTPALPPRDAPARTLPRWTAGEYLRESPPAARWRNSAACASRYRRWDRRRRRERRRRSGAAPNPAAAANPR